MWSLEMPSYPRWSQLRVLVPACLSPVPCLPTIFTFPLTLPSGMNFPTDPTFKFLLLSLLVYGLGDVADSAGLQGVLRHNPDRT